VYVLYFVLFFTKLRKSAKGFIISCIFVKMGVLETEKYLIT